MGSSIAKEHPELLPEWSDRNTVSPDDISYGSNTMLWWKGACGHEWQASAKSRSAGEGCPICANKRVQPGINDLASRYPELMKEWSDRNVLDPTAVSAASHKKAWWRDSLGHEWETEIRYRALHGTGCPYCSHRKLLRGFNDLKSLFPEIAEEWTARNKDLLPEMVMAYSSREVWWKCLRCGHEWKARVADRTRGHGCPSCSGATVSAGIGDLRTLYPEIARDWSDRNGDLTPDKVSPKSRRNVWWKCSKCGYEWKGVIYARVRGMKCSACENRAVMPGVNDLATTDPDLVKEWDHELNEEDPHKVSRNSMRTVKWRCGYGHRYRMKISDRTLLKKGCPDCEKEFIASLPRLAVSYYASLAKMSTQIGTNEEEIPVGLYVPGCKLAIDFCSKTGKMAEYMRLINSQLCRRKEITLVEIYPGKRSDPASILSAVKKAFKRANVFLTTDEKKDLEIITNKYNILRDKMESKEYA